jgi:thiol-disulfide isomerase/thioredoxin
LKRWSLELLLFVAIFAAIQFWQQRDVPRGPAPPITGRLASGEPFAFSTWLAKQAGRPVALHFWADWCPICSTEESSVSAVARDHPVMTIAMQSGGSAQILKYLQSRGLAWPAVVDADGGIAASFGLKGVPAFIVIDQQGRIRSVSVGYTTEAGMRLRLWWAQHF